MLKAVIPNLKQIFNSNKWIIGLLLIYTILYTFNLDKYPSVWADEALFTNPAFTLVTQGFLGTAIMPAFYNIAHFTYWQMPAYLILLAISFKLFGFGIIQARMVSVILGLFTVLFTYLLGKELYSEKIGLLSALILVVNPLFFLIARQARMDIAMVCFALIALYFLVIALKSGKYDYYFGSGFFAMLSVLSHPNGIFGVIIIILSCFIYKFDFKNLKFNFNVKDVSYFILGPILLIIPYMYYISLDFPAFLSQFKYNQFSK